MKLKALVILATALPLFASAGGATYNWKLVEPLLEQSKEIKATVERFKLEEGYVRLRPISDFSGKQLYAHPAEIQSIGRSLAGDTHDLIMFASSKLAPEEKFVLVFTASGIVWPEPIDPEKTLLHGVKVMRLDWDRYLRANGLPTSKERAKAKQSPAVTAAGSEE